MEKNIYTLVREFKCCGKIMVTVIIEDRAACVMSELEYNRIIEAERKSMLQRKQRLRKSCL